MHNIVAYNGPFPKEEEKDIPFIKGLWLGQHNMSDADVFNLKLLNKFKDNVKEIINSNTSPPTKVEEIKKLIDFFEKMTF